MAVHKTIHFDTITMISQIKFYKFKNNDWPEKIYTNKNNNDMLKKIIQKLKK